MPHWTDPRILAEALHEMADMVATGQVRMMEMNYECESDMIDVTSWSGFTRSYARGTERQYLTMKFELLHGSKMERAVKQPPALPPPRKKLTHDK